MNDFFEAGEGFERMGLIDQAVDAFEQAAGSGVRVAEALMRKALLDTARGAVRAALRDLERAATADPANPYPHMRLAQLTSGMGRRTATVEHMRRAIAIAPWSMEMQVNLVSAYLRAEWRDAAHAAARAIPADVGDWWAQTRRDGVAWYRESRGEALAALRRRRAEAPDHNGLLYLAKLLLRAGRLSAAKRICERLFADNEGWFLPLRVLADIRLREAGPEAALALLATYRTPPDPPDYLQADLLEARATFLNEAGRWNELVAELDARPEAERREFVRHTAAVAAFMAGRDEALRAHCIQWMRDYPLAANAGAFIVLLHAREAARSPAPVEPRPASVHLAQFWDQPEPPAEVVEVMGEWTRLNPGLTRTLFDKTAARAFVAAHCGDEATRALDLCYHPAMMADVFRIAFLQVSGGLYADADEVCIRPLDGLLPDIDRLELFAPRQVGMPGFVDTPFLGAREGGRILRTVLDDIVANILQAAQEGRRPLIWEVTGPGALTRGVARHLADGGAAEEVRLVPLQQVRTFVQTRDMAYKLDPRMNWRIAVG